VYEKFSKALKAISLLLITPNELIAISMTKYDVECHLQQTGLLRVACFLSLPKLTYWANAKDQLRFANSGVSYVAIVDDDFRKEFESRFKLSEVSPYDTQG